MASGDFISVEAAARQLIGERIAEIALGEGDEDSSLAWAKPYIDEGLAALERGEVVTLEEYRGYIAALLESLEA